jgi:histidinol phosphatase-like enzyme (inositol monophosphatase family)
MDSSQATEFMDFAHTLADTAAQAIEPYFRVSTSVRNKASKDGFDPVTEADHAAELAMRTMIEARYPDHGIIGEELGQASGNSGLRWIIDPIDGTRAFISGLPLWGTLIALYDGRRPVLGIMNQPFTGERFFAREREAYLRRQARQTKLKTRACDALQQATLLTTDPAMFNAAEFASFQRVADQTRLTRYGGDCYAYCMLAMGQIDLVIEADLKIYDVAALIPIVENAAGVITTWEGQPALQAGRIVAAGDKRVHEQALRLLGRG